LTEVRIPPRIRGKCTARVCSGAWYPNRYGCRVPWHESIAFLCSVGRRRGLCQITWSFVEYLVDDHHETCRSSKISGNIFDRGEATCPRPFVGYVQNQ